MENSSLKLLKFYKYFLEGGGKGSCGSLPDSIVPQHEKTCWGKVTVNNQQRQ